MQQAVSLFYRAGSSDKEYHVRIEPKGEKFTVNFAYGRRGSTLSTGTKTQTPVNSEVALNIFEKLVREKKAKGYAEAQSERQYEHSACQPAAIECQLLNPIGEAEVSRLIGDDDWCMQEKFDGRRLLIQKNGAAIHGINRKALMVGLPSSLVAQVEKIPADFIMDGECVGEFFHAFDLIRLDGDNFNARSYEDRLNAVTDLLDAVPLSHMGVVETAYQTSEKISMLQRLKGGRKEGVVFKRLDAPYTVGRPNTGGTQLKHKFYATASVLVTKVNQQRSVEISVLKGGGWKNAGNVTIPANHSIPQPGAVIEVRYLYAFRQSGCLYQPTYLGTRSDIAAKECVDMQFKFKADAA